jgi:hypothetical protein
MTNERVLTEAQIDLGVELRLWSDLRIARMFFILLSRGMPVAEAIDIIAEYKGIKAAGRQWREPSPENALPMLTCKGCGATFQPKTRQQTYHNKDCQQEAAYRRVLAKAHEKNLAYAAEVEAAKSTEASEPEAETIVGETTPGVVSEERDFLAEDKAQGQNPPDNQWALGRSITERNNPDEK